MTPDEAYEEALRRIREAEETGAELDLSNLPLNRLPLELECLTSLQYLNLFNCKQRVPLAGLTSLQSLVGGSQLSGDLSPLASLTSLQSPVGGSQLSGDLSPLADLTALQSLKLSGCKQLSGDLSPLAGLTSLQEKALGTEHPDVAVFTHPKAQIAR
jgi:hypothetical protein